MTADSYIPPQLAAEVAHERLRYVLEEMCKLRGLSLQSSNDPMQPARNYELMERLGLPEWLVLGRDRPEGETK